jgi:transcriptional regulator with XRE-family HTH domain
MVNRKRTALSLEAERANRAQLVSLGSAVRDARIRRRWTQAQLGARVGLSQSAISRAERGSGGGLTIDSWQRISIALGIRLRIQLDRDPQLDVADAGHLAIQELVLRLARTTGRVGSFELATRAAEPWRSVDVHEVDEGHRCLVIAECWNTIGDIGAGARSSARKRAEAEAAAVARWGEEGRAGLVWVVRSTSRNRRLLSRYPEVFGARFGGPSRAWVAALVHGAEPPREDGLVWADVSATRLFEWRRAS